MQKKKQAQDLAPSYVLTCQGQSSYKNGVETFISLYNKARTAFQAPTWKVSALEGYTFKEIGCLPLLHHRGECFLCLLQCFCILTCAACPAPWAAPTEQNTAQKAPSHLPGCTGCTWLGRERKTLQYPSTTHTYYLLYQGDKGWISNQINSEDQPALKKKILNTYTHIKPLQQNPTPQTKIFNPQNFF